VNCVVDLAAAPGERLAVSAAVLHSGEAAWATVRLHIVGQPAAVSVTIPDTAALIRLLLRAVQQLCDKAVAAGVTLPGQGWGRAALLVDDALVSLAAAEQADG
jgi:hypothetical protein